MKCRAMTIIMQFCMVLAVMVSAFFYAPMEVSASELNSGNFSYSTWLNDNAQNYTYKDSDAIVFPSGFDSDSYYKIDYTLNYNIDFSDNFQNSWINYLNILFRGEFLLQNKYHASLVNNVHIGSVSGSFVLNGSQLYDNANKLRFMLYLENSTNVRLDIAVDYDFVIDNISLLSSNDSNDYQNGYNAGYSAGEQAGYGNGYSQGFTDGEASVDTGAIYDEAFQAGKDSVDTQSYYDAGYQAGYQVAYQEGYDSGYDVGYQSAMDRVANWGADTSDYPLELSSGNTNAYFSVHVGSDIPFNYRDSDHWFSSSEYNPNHTYKYVINFSNIDEGLDSDILYDYWDIYLNVGGIEYNITPFKDMSVSVFIPGDRISTSYCFDWVLYNCANFVADDSNLAYLYVDYDFVIYDMGPSGDTQNHIANQTDQLTNGYDSSQGAAVNDDFKASVNEYHTAEDSLFSTATTSLENFTFLDFTSITGMVTSLSFVTSIMTSIYMAMGGDTGASGIILAVLFSVMLVSMSIGLYRYYVSNGKSNGSGKGGD